VRAMMQVLRRRRRDERGAVAIEAALVVPLVIIMLMGIVEFSLLLRDYVAVTSAARAGTRLASAEPGAGQCSTTLYPTCVPASVPALAQDAANGVQNGLTGVPATSIDYILVYRANDKGYPGAAGSTSMPSSCSGIASCVMFTYSTSAQGFRYNSGSWDSKTINACVNDAGQDSIGVYIKATHKWMTGLFGNTIGIGDRAMNKFEPLPQESCKPGTISPHP
jgi:Flp pilus assembly pilin Flp